MITVVMITLTMMTVMVMTVTMTSDDNCGDDDHYNMWTRCELCLDVGDLQCGDYNCTDCG